MSCLLLKLLAGFQQHLHAIGRLRGLGGVAFDLSCQRTRQKTGRKHDDKRNRIAVVISRQSKSRFGKHKIKGQHRRQRGDQAAALPPRHDGDNLHAENINRDDIRFTESDLSKSQRKQCTDC